MGVVADNFIHVTDVKWLAWATPRNKLESALKFISIIRRKFTLLMIPAKEDNPFFERLMKYGMAHKAGKLLLDDGTPSPIYQTRG